MPQGSRGRIGIKKEKSWGTRDGELANDVFLPFVSESLTTNIEELLSAAQRGILDEPKSYQGERAFGGDVVVEVHPVSIGHLLRSALGVPKAATLAGTTETELDNCDEAWVGDDSIISGIDIIDKKKGSAAIKLSVPAGVATGTILATKDFAPVVMTSDTHIKFWIKSSIAMNEGDLVFVISELAECTGSNGEQKEITITPLEANVWTELTLAITPMTNYDAVKSIGIKLVNDKLEFILRGDDVRRVVEGSAVAAKQHEFIPMQLSTEEFNTDCPLFPYTLEVFPDQGKAFRFVGGVVNTLALNFSTTDKILKATCGIIAKDLSLQTPIGTLGLEPTKPFVWENAIIRIAAAGTVPATTKVNDIESFGINWDNKCVGKYALNQSEVIRRIVRDGFRTIPVNFTIDFIDKTEYGNFITGIEKSFQIKFEGALISGETVVKYTLQIDLPSVRYLTYPINIGGPGPIVCGVTGKAKYYAAGYALRAIIINDKETSEYQKDV